MRHLVQLEPLWSCREAAWHGSGELSTGQARCQFTAAATQERVATCFSAGHVHSAHVALLCHTANIYLSVLCIYQQHQALSLVVIFPLLRKNPSFILVFFSFHVEGSGTCGAANPSHTVTSGG